MVSKLMIGTLVAALALPVLAAVESGLAVGKMVTPFHPTHVSGPDKGTSNCPPCTYGNRPAVQVWVNGDDMKNVSAIAKTLSNAVKDNTGTEFKAFIIVLTDKANAAKTAASLKDLAGKLNVDNIDIAYLAKDDTAVKNYAVSTKSEMKNTVFVYKDKTVSSKFVNLKADKSGVGQLEAAISNVAAK